MNRKMSKEDQLDRFIEETVKELKSEALKKIIPKAIELVPDRDLDDFCGDLHGLGEFAEILRVKEDQ